MMRPGYRSNTAERPLLLLFPGCCDVMRIRKVQARGLPGSSSSSGAGAGAGNSTSSAAPAVDEAPLPPAEEDSVPALLRSPDRPYMNLDEFVSSLARKNCFPDDKAGESGGGLINFFDDQAVDTCLRLAINPDPVRIKGGHVVDPVDQYHGSTIPSARIESPVEAGHPEVFGESYQTTSIPEPDEAEDEDGQPEKPMKSSTESIDQRPRRTSRSTGRKREWSAEEEEEEEDQEEEDEDESSEHSSQRTKTRKRKRNKSEHSSVTQEVRSSEKKAKSTKKKPGGSSSRSGRPKKLKYMKQENTEELGNQCNRSDGKGWTCPLLAKTGYQLCDHHLDKLRCKPGSRSKYNKSKKKKNQQQQEQALS